MTDQESISAAAPSDRRGGALWKRLELAGVSVRAFVGFLLLGGHRHLSWDAVRSNLDAWQAHVREHYRLALLIYVGAYVAITALLPPVAAALSLIRQRGFSDFRR